MSGLQLINDQKEFNGELSKFMRDKWKMFNLGFDYHIVAVFGSQSSGKSTLLNRLFGTCFDVMGETSRQQTTKGIWVSSAKSNILVMDVEGTDGRERGDDQDFERKSALFSLAVSQVLIINIWEQAVGLYNGANMGLLKTVLEVHLQLFQQKGSAKTLLLFVIRDFIGKTPLSSLANTLSLDLNKIWNGLSKPEEFENVPLSDCFDLKFVGLPHKILMEEKFNEETENLSKWFTVSDDQNYVFQKMYQKNIPADGFPAFSQAIWDKIITNRDLDLPTQQELLAQYRCDEISAEVYGVFHMAMKAIHQELESGKTIDKFGSKVDGARHTAVESFDKVAHRYNNNVYKKKRTELNSKMEEFLSSLFAMQLRNLLKKVKAAFENAFQKALEEGTLSFSQAASQAKQLALEQFNNSVKASTVKEYNWSYEQQSKELESDLSKAIKVRRLDEIKGLVQRLQKSMKSKITDVVVTSFDGGSGENMWKTLFDGYLAMFEGVEKTFVKKLKDFECSEQELKDHILSLKKLSWESLLEILRIEVLESNLVPKLRKKFELEFRYGSDGVPKIWQPGDDIDGAFRKAKEKTESLIPLISKIKVSDQVASILPFSLEKEEADDVTAEEKFVLLTESNQKNLSLQFQKEIELLFIDAKRSVVSGTTSIPPYMLLLLLVLGWNELMAILSSPLLFLLVLLVGGALFVAHQLNYMGPLEDMFWALSRQVVGQVYKFLNQGLSAAATSSSHPRGNRDVTVTSNSAILSSSSSSPASNIS